MGWTAEILHCRSNDAAETVTHLTQVCMNWGKLVCVHLHFVYCLFQDDDTSQRLQEKEEGGREKTLKRCSFSKVHKRSTGQNRLACVLLWNVLKYLDEEQRKKESCCGWLDSERDWSETSGMTRARRSNGRNWFIGVTKSISKCVGDFVWDNCCVHVAFQH